MPNPSPDYWAGLGRRLDRIVAALAAAGIIVLVIVVATLLDRGL
jgi:hypothetical protein